MECLADRFLFEHGRWIDAATGDRVHVHVEDALSLDALDWDEQCGRLFNARHPLLNPLVDYGAAPDGRRFEAYACSGPAHHTPPAAERRLLHLVGFLRAAGIALAGARSRYAVRPVAAGQESRGRPIGITLQPRRALDAVRETLESPAAAPSLVVIVATPMSGLRTAKLLVARTARLLGYVPVCAATLVRDTGGPGPFMDRHLCVLVDDDDQTRRALAGELVRLAARSARRHVVVRFSRQDSQRGAVVLDPLPVRALMGMVVSPAGDGPSEEELFEAARLASGRPGAFLGYLTSSGVALAHGAMVVHETPQEYRAELEADTRPVQQPDSTVTRTLAAALRAPIRAKALAARGRHAAARRAVERASRVLAGRQRPDAAAACLVLAGRLALDRGDSEKAIARFTQARELAPGTAAAIQAAAGLGEAWIDDLRLVEAEAVLRAALTAADTLGDRGGVCLALTGLIRCLCQHERAADAVAAAATVDWPEDRRESIALMAALSRAHAALGRHEGALRLARRAQAHADASADPHTAVYAESALAEALGVAGDLAGKVERLERAAAIARCAHLPVAAIRAELAMAHAIADSPHVDRSKRRLRALQRLTLPRQVRQQVDQAMRALDQRKVRGAGMHDAAPCDIHRETAAALEALLQLCQQAPDDGSAIGVVCGTVLRRVGATSVMVLSLTDRRVLACEGRSWVSHSTVAAQALATGMASSSEAGREPRETADAIRYGGELIATIACRWTPGTAVDALGSGAILHAAALALAAPIRAVLDRNVPPPPASAWGDLVGDSPAAVTLREAVVRAARAPFPVLIEGESGSGKELVARAIHRLGPRRDRRFCPLNCAALTDELVEAELFGHARGAFTGAAVERAGLFEEAHGGTLFLDEIAELSARAQAKLLRVVQEGEVRRVGENFARRTDARIVAATNRRLEEEVGAGRFRADLRFRLDVVRLTVPPLRDRPGDIPLLAAHFWNSASQSVNCHATLTRDTIAALARYDWPGNVRELQNVIAWIAVHSPRRGRIGPSSLPAHVARAAAPTACTFEAARTEFERRFIRAALAGANGQRAKAAEALGVSRQGLAKIIRRLGIEPQ